LKIHPVPTEIMNVIADAFSGPEGDTVVVVKRNDGQAFYFAGDDGSKAELTRSISTSKVFPYHQLDVANEIINKIRKHPDIEDAEIKYIGRTGRKHRIAMGILARKLMTTEKVRLDSSLQLEQGTVFWANPAPNGFYTITVKTRVNPVPVKQKVINHFIDQEVLIDVDKAPESKPEKVTRGMFATSDLATTIQDESGLLQEFGSEKTEEILNNDKGIQRVKDQQGRWTHVRRLPEGQFLLDTRLYVGYRVR